MTQIQTFQKQVILMMPEMPKKQVVRVVTDMEMSWTKSGDSNVKPLAIVSVCGVLPCNFQNKT